MTIKTASQRGSLFDSLNVLAQDIATAKTAAARTKQAGPTPADPGGYQGATSHPTKDAPNNVQETQEGERSSENESDVKEDQGAPSVNNAAEATPKEGSGDQDSVQLHVGLKPSATGEDPASEDDYKGDKDDPGTSHPAKTDDGEKYASLSFKQARAEAARLGNDILADLVNGFGDRLQPASKQAGAAPQAGRGAQLQKAAASAAQSQQTQEILAGYELASQLGLAAKQAQAHVAESLEHTIRDARLDADLFGSYYSAALAKMASEDGGGEGEDHSAPGDEESGASDAPAGGGDAAGGGDGGGGDPLAALTGGGGGSDPMGGGGGDPMGGMGGGMGGGDPMGGGMGQPSEEQALAELAAALEELGIPIEALAQAGGGGGGMPPGGDPMGGGGGDPMAAMGGAPPGAPPGGDPGLGAKLAAAVRQFKRSGRYQIKEARTPQQRALRDHMKRTVLELVGG